MDLLMQSNKLGNLNPELIPEEENVVNTYLPKTLKKIIMGGNATPTQKMKANQYIYKTIGDDVVMFTTEQHDLAVALTQKLEDHAKDLEAQAKEEMRKEERIEQRVRNYGGNPTPPIVKSIFLKSIAADLLLDENIVENDFDIDNGLDFLDNLSPEVIESMYLNPNTASIVARFDPDAMPVNEGFGLKQFEEDQLKAYNLFWKQYMPLGVDSETPISDE